MTTSLRRDRVALNAIQWINVKADPADPQSEDLWRYADPAFRADYPDVLDQIRRAGFGAVMMEVLGTQTLQDFARMIEDSGLALAPGYASIGLPEDHDLVLPAGSAERVHWFDGIRRKAEESNFVGLDTVFLAPEVGWGPAFPRTGEAVAVGAAFDQGRLDRQIGFLAEATEVLAAEGIRAGLHNHVGTWIETEDEIEQTLAAIPSLGASFDVGHLAWAGIDPVAMLRRHADRLPSGIRRRSVPRAGTRRPRSARRPRGAARGVRRLDHRGGGQGEHGAVRLRADELGVGGGCDPRVGRRSQPSNRRAHLAASIAQVLRDQRVGVRCRSDRPG